MVDKQFESGNYNEWNKFVTDTLPKKHAIIRKQFLPVLDNILEGMLGEDADIDKTSIDVKTSTLNNSLHEIICDIVYTVKDFIVPEAPKEAKEEDENAIKDNLQIDGVEVRKLDINTSSGKLEIEIIIPLLEG